MKNNILVIVFVSFLFITCGKKDETKEVEAPIKKEKLEVVKETTQPITEELEEINPLSKYMSDEVYNEGIKLFYSEKESMFMEDSSGFSYNYENFKAYIEGRFKPTMLIKQNGVNSAVVYYLDNGSKKRTIIMGHKIIEIEEVKYFIKAFKDRIEIKQGENGKAVPLYLREG